MAAADTASDWSDQSNEERPSPSSDISYSVNARVAALRLRFPPRGRTIPGPHLQSED
jgi:hypothetical protein